MKGPLEARVWKTTICNGNFNPISSAPKHVQFAPSKKQFFFQNLKISELMAAEPQKAELGRFGSTKNRIKAFVNGEEFWHYCCKLSH